MISEKEVTLLDNGKSFRITLPKNMVRNMELRKGDKLDVIQLENEFLVKPKRHQESNTVFSIGYQERSIDEFISYLCKNNIKQLIDIRDYPNSRKKGFSKSQLKKRLEECGIDYRHISKLGTDKKSRYEYKESGDIDKLIEDFNKKLENNRPALEELKALVNYKDSVIMCYERDHEECHRQVLESELKNDGFRVKHL